MMGWEVNSVISFLYNCNDIEMYAQNNKPIPNTN